jgi:hypothetical protein
MKTWKQTAFFGMMAIIAIIFTLVACDNESDKDSDTNNTDSTQNGGNNGKGGYDQNNKWHSLADPDVCQGGCIGPFGLARVGIRVIANTQGLINDQAKQAEKAFDDAAWDSWYGNGGDYHNYPKGTLYVSNAGGRVEYYVPIDGKNKTPCFSDEDRANAEAAGNATINAFLGQ